MDNLMKHFSSQRRLFRWVMALALALGFVAAIAQVTGRSFDHFKTGFPLTGMHATARCESCHINGVFHGTTRNCADCHVDGNTLAVGNIVKPANHFPTPLLCSSCHSTTTFVGVKFDHLGIRVGGCLDCHNGRITTGKPFGPTARGFDHATTSASCDSCHSTRGWTPANSLDHTGFTVATNCVRCHDGTGALGKIATHMPTANNCISCHSPVIPGFRPTSWNHTQMPVANQCAVCHTGTYSKADGLSTNHVPYKSLSGVAITSCDTCHKGSFTAWNNGQFHSNVSISTQCATCHLTTVYGVTGKATTPIHSTPEATGTACESCHTSTASWQLAKPSHSSFTAATNCSTCHNGTIAPGKNSTHFPTALNCETCHSPTGAAWKPTKWNHTQMPVAAQCSTCHTGAYLPADGINATHIPYAGVAPGANCDTCHKGGYTAWYPGRLHANVAVTNSCETCHLTTAYGATGKPSTAVHTGVVNNCQTCHNTTSWLGAKPDHTTFNAATNCLSCHDGSNATGKTTTHIPTTANCVLCHSPTLTMWKPANWNHTQVPVVAQCDTCHTGTYPPAGGKIANHIPYASIPAAAAAKCDTCHTAGYVTWNPGYFHKYITVPIVPATGNVCATCHYNAGYSVTQKPANTTHATVTGNCEKCHSSTTIWSSSKPDHSAFLPSQNCLGCHGPGGSTVGQPSNHIATAANCSTCHIATQATWRPSFWKHDQGVAVTGVCANCHNGVIGTAPTATHISREGLGCDSCHRTSPVGVAIATLTWKIPVWDHTWVPTAPTRCSTCHTGVNPPALGKTANHIPYASIAASAAANCNACHKGGYASWNPGKFHINFTSVTTQCATCHLTSAYGVTSKPATAVHATVTGNCESCHTSTSTWLGARPNHTLYNAATNCVVCHDGVSATGKNTTHFPTTLNCVSCHSATGATWKPTTWNHTQMPVVNQCATCHSGAYPPADGKTANHIPYSGLTGVVITNCDTCHKGGYATWNPGKFHSNVSITTQCATCHLTTAYALTGKPATATHASVTGNCESCHISTASWLTYKYTHSPANAVGTGTCDTCHYTGGTGKGKTATHIPVPAVAKCDACHKSQVSFAAPTMNHTAVVTATCKSCHNGAYTSEGVSAAGAQGKPSNHIPEATKILNGAAMDCNACHIGTTVWTNEKMNHNGSLGNGSGWCIGCHVTGTAYLGNMQRKALAHNGGTSVKTDCSQSGCHKPLGKTGSTYAQWS